jgi:hypothetical protein
MHRLRHAGPTPAPEGPEATFEAGPGKASGDFVLRKAPVIFRCGEYDFPPEKGGPFSFTRDDLNSFLASFNQPVELEAGHHDTVFDGQLGQLVHVHATPDGNGFGGKVRLAPWLDGLFKDQPIKLSASPAGGAWASSTCRPALATTAAGIATS